MILLLQLRLRVGVHLGELLLIELRLLLWRQQLAHDSGGVGVGRGCRWQLEPTLDHKRRRVGDGHSATEELPLRSDVILSHSACTTLTSMMCVRQSDRQSPSLAVLAVSSPLTKGKRGARPRRVWGSRGQPASQPGEARTPFGKCRHRYPCEPRHGRDTKQPRLGRSRTSTDITTIPYTRSHPGTPRAFRSMSLVPSLASLADGYYSVRALTSPTHSCPPPGGPAD